jgi:energy-coupling factor transporter transmembrane protein EcfT
MNGGRQSCLGSSNPVKLPAQPPRALMFDPFFAWVESTAFSVWLVESTSIFAFPFVLALHTIGLGLVAGLNIALDLRILGVAPQVPVREFRRFVPFMWFGFWLNATSGVALLIGYPTKALTNPVFYLKLGLIAAALVLFSAVRRRVLTDRTPTATFIPRRLKILAATSLACWAGATVAGRLLAYTYTRLTVTG